MGQLLLPFKSDSRINLISQLLSARPQTYMINYLKKYKMKTMLLSGKNLLSTKGEE
jgi:hypothetical protein